MPTLSPSTLTEGEQRTILAATAVNPRDHLIYSLALGTGVRLAESVGLDVGDVLFPDDHLPFPEPASGSAPRSTRGSRSLGRALLMRELQDGP